MVRPVDLMGMSPLMYFLCCKTSSLIRDSTKWNVTMVDKSFCEFTDGYDSGSIVGKEGEFVFRILFVPARTNIFSLHDGRNPV